MIANTGKLAGRTIFITGASRGIGKEIALKAARDGANIIVAAKTADPHPKLLGTSGVATLLARPLDPGALERLLPPLPDATPLLGTIYTAAKEIEAAGGKALPCIVDVRDEAQVTSAVENAVKQFGGIDALINNASAISLTKTVDTEMKRYDLMHNINTRGTFLVSKVCIPHLLKSSNPHIVNISPPLNLAPHWFAPHVSYTMAKYGMSMCVLGMAEEFKDDGIAVNAVWPKTAIHTAAIEMLTGPESSNHSRKPEIVADTVYSLLCKDSRSITGQFLVDEDYLRAEGVTDFAQYACNPEYKDKLMPDFFLDIDPDTILAAYAKGGATKASLDKSAGKGDKVTDSGSGKVEDIFTAIQSNLSSELVNRTEAIFQFNVKGDDASTWFIDLKNGKGSAGKGEPGQPADATLTMDAKNFFAMFTGKLKPASAFMTGKLKISGDLQKAMKLEDLMNSLKSKL